MRARLIGNREKRNRRNNCFFFFLFLYIRTKLCRRRGLSCGARLGQTHKTHHAALVDATQLVKVRAEVEAGGDYRRRVLAANRPFFDLVQALCLNTNNRSNYMSFMI